MRIYAMYEGSKKMLVFLCCTFGVTVGSVVALSVLNVPPLTVLNRLDGDGKYASVLFKGNFFPYFQCGQI